jgi:hypothetical protein
VARSVSPRRRGHQTTPAERTAVVVVAALGGLVGAFAPAQPTAWTPTDIALRAGAVAVLSLAASRARRWTWIVGAGLAAVGAPSGLWFGVGVTAVLASLVGVAIPRRRLSGAVVGALTGVVLLHLPDHGVNFGSALLVLAASGPILVSAYAVSPRRVRRRVHRTLLVAVALVALGSIVAAIGAALAFGDASRGATQARSGLSAISDGDTARAQEQLDAAASSFDRASSVLSGWWMTPARAVPVVGQQVAAVETMAVQGEQIARTGADASSIADPQELRYADGGLDVALVEAAAPSLQGTADALAQAQRLLAADDSPWLFGPVASRLSAFRRQVDDVAPTAANTADAAHLAPALFGADGTRRYLVLFTTPAESRGLGGFVGSWGLLTAEAGRVRLERTGRPNELNSAPGNCIDRRVIAATPSLSDYVDRYGRFNPGCFFQDISFSPDLPTVAAVAGQLFPKMGGPAVDGVLQLDPYALAALLEFTGPVQVAGIEDPLTADNAAAFLVRDQYTEFEGADPERREVLADAADAVFTELLAGSLPGPRALADVLSPLADERRIGFVSFRSDEAALFDRIGASGRFGLSDVASDTDRFSLVTQNGSNNKIDLYLERSVDYRATYDPDTGELDAKATITLKNTAPSEGLPPAVIGSNDRGLPPGTNRVFFSFYSGLGLKQAEIDGEVTPLQYQRELGSKVYSTFVDIAAGASVTIVLDLHGQLVAGRPYRLVVARQPLTTPEEIRAQVDLDGNWEVGRTDGLNSSGERDSATLLSRRPSSIDVSMTVRRR